MATIADYSGLLTTAYVPQTAIPAGSSSYRFLRNPISATKQLWVSKTARVVTDGTTATNTTVTSATAAFTTADIGRGIFGLGIPLGAYITARASATSVTISAAATATASGLSLAIGGFVALDPGDSISMESGYITHLAWTVTSETIGHQWIAEAS